MEKEKSDKLIADAAKTIFSYCRARTNTKEEAEDLSQDIILKLLKKQKNLRDDKAFYGFMWTIAGNVCKEWYKKRNKIVESELDESIPDDSVPLIELLEKESDLRLLYRELALLTEQYRKVVVLYYFDDFKVSDISKSLGISESMVKFLLFKTRKILKEGMNMERAKGDLSFNPAHISLMVWGENPHAFWDLCGDNMIVQNILLACYNDRCTAEEISLQIGVAVPYLERDLKKLCEKDLLIQKGGRYETNIVIFTTEFLKEADEKTLPVKNEIAEIIVKCLNERLSDIKTIGFYRGIEDDNLLKWLMTHIIFRESDSKYGRDNNIIFPKNYGGAETFICGEEYYPNQPALGGVASWRDNANGDVIYFMDSDLFYFDRYPNRVNIILDITRGKNTGFSENDMIEIADFIKHGYVRKNGDELKLNLPVFTREQYDKTKILIDDITTIIAEKTREIVSISTDILVQHTPTSMKKDAENLGWTRKGDCAGIPFKIIVDNGILQQVAENTHPSTFVALA